MALNISHIAGLSICVLVQDAAWGACESKGWPLVFYGI